MSELTIDKVAKSYWQVNLDGHRVFSWAAHHRVCPRWLVERLAP